MKTTLLLAAFLFAAPAFPARCQEPAAPAQPPAGREPTAEERAELARFFVELNKAFKSGESGRIAAVFDPQRALQAMESLGTLPEKAGQMRELVIEQLPIALAKQVSNPAFSMVWEKIEVRSIRMLKEGSEAEIYTRSWDASDTSSKTRWWLVRHGDSWRFYDLEDLSLAARFSTMFVVGLRMADQGDVTSADVKRVITAIQRVFTGELEQARQELEALEGTEFAPEFDRLRHMMLAAILVEFGETYAAIRSLDKAMAAANGDMPILHLLYAEAYNDLDQPDRALEHAEKYAARLGRDAEYYYAVGMAHATANRVEQAVDAYRKGLADDPLHGEMVFALIYAARDQPEMLLEHYRKLHGVEEWFSGFVDVVEWDEDPDTLRLLIDLHKQVKPDDPNLARAREVLDRLEAAPPAE